MNEWILFCASTCNDLILSGTGQWMHKDNVQPKMLLCHCDSATTVAKTATTVAKTLLQL